MPTSEVIASVAPQEFIPPKQRISRDEWVMRGAALVIGVFLLLMLFAPLYALFSKSFEDNKGNFIGFKNYLEYFQTPSLLSSIEHSLFVATLSTVISLCLAFPFAYALTRTAMPFKGLLKGIALSTILAPGMLWAISLRYLFGNQGLLKWMLGDYSIYGPIGIVAGHVKFTFPFALLIIATSLATADARLYEAALALRARKARIFFTVTLPGAKYGLISSAFVAFTLSITDFTVPKIIGGQYNMIATDVYKQVVGQQNFEIGAVVGVVLLVPAMLAFIVDRLAQRRQMATLTADAVPYVPRPSRTFDAAMLCFCVVLGLIMIGMLCVSLYASLITYWPYNLTFTLANYDFNRVDDQGWRAYGNSLQLSAWTALIGTCVVFVGAYMVEKTRGFHAARTAIHFMAVLPMAVPGLVLGISYVFFFVRPENPLSFLYNTMGIMVISTIIHYYPVSHLIAITALKQMDRSFESISASLKTPLYQTFWRVTVPVCLPAILEIATFLFVNAMHTTSAVIFLYAPETLVASVSIINMDESGTIASASAMSIVIFATSAAVRLGHWALVRGLERRTQAWRQR